MNFGYMFELKLWHLVWSAQTFNVMFFVHLTKTSTNQQWM